jgi:hypothetical protein
MKGVLPKCAAKPLISGSSLAPLWERQPRLRRGPVAAERLIPIYRDHLLSLNSLPVSQSRQITLPFPGYLQTIFLSNERYGTGLGGAITTSMNLMWKFTACAAVVGCAVVLSGAASARGGGGGGGGFHGGGGFYGGRGGWYGGRSDFQGGRGGFQGGRGGFQGGRGSSHGDRGGFQSGGGFHNGVPIGGQGSGGFHNGVPIGGQGSGGFHNGVPIGEGHIGEGGHRGHHHGTRRHRDWWINPIASADLSFGAPHKAREVE